MPLQRYGTGFLKGLAQVAGQAKADLRDKEDTESRNNLAMAQLAMQSGDPVLIQGALDRLTDDFGGGKPGAGGKKKAGGAADPKSLIAQALIGGLDRDEGGGAAQDPLRLSTAEETAGRAEEATAREIAKGVQLDEAKIAQLRRAGVSPEQIALIAQQLAGVPVGPTGFAPQGSVPFTAGVPGEQIPPRPVAAANLQLVQRNRPGDPEGAPPSDFLFAPDTGQLFNMDRTPVTEALETRRAPPSDLARRQTAAFVAQEAQEARYEAIPDNYRNLVSAATRQLPATAQASTQADATDLWEQGDLAGLQRLIRNTVFSEADPNTRRQVEGRDTAMQALTEIEGLLDELAAAGVTTGKFAGTVERGLRYIGRTTSPEIARLTTRIGDTVIAYRSAVSGAAFTESEGEAYEALFPSMGNTADLNKALIAGIRQSMQSRNQRFWTQRLGAPGAELVGAAGAQSPLTARQYLIMNNKAVTDESLAAATEFLQAHPELRPR